MFKCFFIVLLRAYNDVNSMPCSTYINVRGRSYTFTNFSYFLQFVECILPSYLIHIDKGNVHMICGHIRMIIMNIYCSHDFSRFLIQIECCMILSPMLLSAVDKSSEASNQTKILVALWNAVSARCHCPVTMNTTPLLLIVVAML